MGLRPLLWSLLFVSAAALPLSAADISDIDIEVTTDRTFYDPGEEVAVVVNQCNPTDEVITQQYGCPCCHDIYSIVDAQGEEVAACGFGCIQVVFDETWQPGECKTDEFSWTQLAPDCDFGNQVADGIYRIQHEFKFNQIDFLRTTVGERFVIGDGPVEVPSLSTYGLAAMATGLGLAAILFLARRRL